MSKVPEPQRKMTAEMLDESKNKLDKLLTTEEVVEFCDGDLDNVTLCALSSLLVTGQYSVKTVRLRNNGLTDASLCTLAAALNYDSSIEVLDLADNDLTQRGVYHLLLCLTSFNETLTDLNLENNVSICSIGIRYVGEILENNKFLQRLNLSGIELEKSVESLAEGLSRNSTLKYLNLSSCSLGSRGTNVFIKTIVNERCLLGLEELNLSFNPILDGNFDIYLPLFTETPFMCLKSLNLNFNQMMFNANNKFSLALSHGMKNNITLEKLYLEGNLFNDEDSKNLSTLLRSNLVDLDLKDNNFTVTGLDQFLSVVKEKHTLKSFNLEENKFMDDAVGVKKFAELNRFFAPNPKDKSPKRSSPAEYIKPERKESTFGDLELYVAPAEHEKSVIMRNQSKFNLEEDYFNEFEEMPPLDKGESFRSMRRNLEFSAESNLGSKEPLMTVSRAMKTQLLNLAKEFPQTAEPEKAKKKKIEKKKKGKRRFVSKIEKIKDLKREKQEGPQLQTLAKSAIHQRMISQDLKSKATLMTPAEQLRRQIAKEFGGFKSLLPSVLMDELTGVFEEANILLPSIELLEMYVRSIKMISTVTWCLLQSFVGFENANKDLCREVLEAFAQNLKSEDSHVEKIYGVQMLEGLFMQLSDSLILLKPLYSFAEALLLVMTSERSLVQPRLSFYEKRHQKLEARAKRHIQRRAQKVQAQAKVENLKKILKRAQENGGTGGHEKKDHGEGHKNLDKVLRGVEKKKNKAAREAMKKEGKESQQGTLKRQPTAKTASVSEDVMRFRSNCPERVEDVLDDLKESSAVLDSLLSIENFLPSMSAFIDYEKMLNHIRYRVASISKHVPNWFVDLKHQFNCVELEHIMPEIVKEINADINEFNRRESVRGSTSVLQSDLTLPLTPQALNGTLTRKTVKVAGSVASTTSRSVSSTKSKGLFARFKSKMTMKKEPSSFKEQDLLFDSEVDEDTFDYGLLDGVCLGKTEGSAKLRKLRLELEARLSKTDASKMSLAMEMKKLATGGTKETVSLTTMKLKEKFENELASL